MDSSPDLGIQRVVVEDTCTLGTDIKTAGATLVFLQIRANRHALHDASPVKSK